MVLTESVKYNKFPLFKFTIYWKRKKFKNETSDFLIEHPHENNRKPEENMTNLAQLTFTFFSNNNIFSRLLDDTPLLGYF